MSLAYFEVTNTQLSFLFLDNEDSKSVGSGLIRLCRLATVVKFVEPTFARRW